MTASAPHDFDLAIIGGGPAGATLALALVREEGIAPHRIVVLDKAAFPRNKPCAGAISELGVRALAELGVRPTVPYVTMRGVRVLTRRAVGETFAPMGIVVRRSEFDAQLLDEARAAGVVVRDGEGLTAVTRAAFGFELVTTKGTVRTRLLAACDGAGSTTRKLLGIREAERKGHLYVLETAPRDDDHGTRRGLVDFDLSVLGDGLAGYYWDFPTVIGGVPHVSRGIYHANFERAGREERSVDVKGALARALAKRHIDIAQVRLQPFPTRPFVRGSATWQDGVVLVGEACGIDHTTGEGIAQAIVMARMAARHLARALRTGGHSFEAYQREVFRSTIGKHMLQSATLARMVYGRLGAPARKYLLGSSYARTEAMRWYRGEGLSFVTQLKLGLGIAASTFARSVD